MGKFYILCDGYAPNQAYANHNMSFFRGFSELGVKAELVYIMPDTYGSIMEQEFPGIKVKYLWSTRFLKSRLLRNLNMICSYGKFFFSLKKGDVLLLLGCSEYLYFLVRRKGVKVFHERTEHPAAYHISRFKFFRDHYLDSCAKADGVLPISKALSDFFESSGVNHDKLQIINMVVDESRFTNVIKQKGIEKYIAYCGNGANRKDGVDLLLKSFAMISDRCPEYKLYIIGKAPSNDSENYRLAEELGIINRVVFTGIVPAAEIPQLLTNADILALARPDSIQNTYGFPTKLGEYLLTGNPVVITKVGDIPRFLIDKESALMSDCGDIEAFADNLLWAIQNPQKAKAIGERGRIVARENFNYLKESKKIIDFIFNRN